MLPIVIPFVVIEVANPLTCSVKAFTESLVAEVLSKFVILVLKSSSVLVNAAKFSVKDCDTELILVSASVLLLTTVSLKLEIEVFLPCIA